MASEDRVWPDFEKMEMDGVGVLTDGLPALPKELSYSTPIPLAYCKSDARGAVVFLFYFETQEGDIKSADIPLLYNRNDAGWQPDKNQRFMWAEDGGGRIDPIGSPSGLEYSDYFARGWSGDDYSALSTSWQMYNSDPEPAGPAIYRNGRRAPDVAEIWLIQEGSTQRSPADGHFGFWVICTDTFAPYRVEARDASGKLVGFIDDHMKEYFPELPLAVLTPDEVEQPHRFGGRVRVSTVERYREKTIVKWHATLEPDPDVQLAADLDAHGLASADPWSEDRIAMHVQLIDVLKLTVLFDSRPTLSDDLGTEYASAGSSGSTGSSEVTWNHTFEPAIPDAATVLTLRWEDTEFRVSLR